MINNIVHFHILSLSIPYHRIYYLLTNLAIWKMYRSCSFIFKYHMAAFAIWSVLELVIWDTVYTLIYLSFVNLCKIAATRDTELVKFYHFSKTVENKVFIIFIFRTCSNLMLNRIFRIANVAGKFWYNTQLWKMRGKAIMSSS